MIVPLPLTGTLGPGGCVTGVVAAAGQVPHSGNAGWAVVLAVFSTCCYAASAALQQREAASRGVSPGLLVLKLARRPLWWLAILATAAGATLHIAALALGPLSLVQPLGVLTLVFALPLGARLGGRAVTPREWGAAIVVALGLAALLTAAAHHAPPAHPPTSALVGGLGAPLATLNLVDPLVAVVLGVAVLGKPFPLTLARVALVAVGLVATSSGIGMLTLPPRSGRLPAVHDSRKVAHVVR